MQKVNQFVTIFRKLSLLLPILLLFGVIAAVSRTLPPLQIIPPRHTEMQNEIALPRGSGGQGLPQSEMNNATAQNSNTSALRSTYEQGGADIMSENTAKTICGTVRVKIVSSGEIRTMPIEEYVLCALLGEMPQTFGAEALKAQAVAARTMAVYMAKCETGKHADCDICTDFNHCQSFLDAESAAFDISSASHAVEATKGMIALYGGRPILAAYHASSGRTTNSSQAVWGGALDYLVPVMAPENPDGSAPQHGHGVGMSQYGAKTLAGNGYDFLEILQYYYPGTTLGFLEETDQKHK